MTYVGYSMKDKVIIVSFRGTKGFQDSILDGLAWMKRPFEINDCSDCMVEAGFDFAYRQLQNAIDDSIEIILNTFGDNFRIMVTYILC